MLPNSSDPGSPSAQKNRKRRVGLSLYHEDRLKRQLRESAPSEPWVEAQFITALDQDQEGEPIVYRYHDPRAFPPGGAETGMIRCPVCGIFMPPNAFEDGQCLDHADHSAWGRSPSAIAIEALQMRNLRLIDSPLPSEDISALREEISKFYEKRAQIFKSSSHQG
jgi:hypothetical protein